MPHTDYTLPAPGQLDYSYARFASAKLFLFERWCELALDRQTSTPTDLSSACKYGSLFAQSVFGGCIRGHYEHQYNFIGGRLVDLSHDSLDVGRMRNPYLHEAAYFQIPEVQTSLARCAPRATHWASEFLKHQTQHSCNPSTC